MDSLDKILSALQARLEALSASPRLSVNEALARISEIVELADADMLAALESERRFEEATTVYERVAEAFEIAAQRVPEEDKQRMISLGSYWALKANAVRLASQSVAVPPESLTLPYTGQHMDPVTGRLSQKIQRQIQRQRLDLATDESSPSAKVRPQQAVDLKKPGEVQAGSETEVRISPLTRQFEKETTTRQQFSRKKPRLDRDLEIPRASEKGA